MKVPLKIYTVVVARKVNNGDTVCHCSQPKKKKNLGGNIIKLFIIYM